MSIPISKNTRLNTVYETVAAMGSAQPVDICRRVAQRLGADLDSAFTRAVYRDLKQLADDGRLLADVFSPEGLKLSPEQAEDSKNIRIEYRVADQDSSSVTGWKLLHDIGGRIVTSTIKMGWKVAYAVNTDKDNFFSLLFQGVSGRIAVLQLPKADLPARILFCRESDMEPLPANFQSTMSEIYGVRTLAFACPSPTVSRGQSTGTMGHALISIQRDGRMSLVDFASKTGTFYAEQSVERISAALGSMTNNDTAPIEQNPFETVVEWLRVNEIAVALPSAATIRLGSYRIAVLIKLNS